MEGLKEEVHELKDKNKGCEKKINDLSLQYSRMEKKNANLKQEKNQLYEKARKLQD